MKDIVSAAFAGCAFFSLVLIAIPGVLWVRGKNPDEVKPIMLIGVLLGLVAMGLSYLLSFPMP